MLGISVNPLEVRRLLASFTRPSKWEVQPMPPSYSESLIVDLLERADTRGISADIPGVKGLGLLAKSHRFLMSHSSEGPYVGSAFLGGMPCPVNDAGNLDRVFASSCGTASPASSCRKPSSTF